MEDKRKLEVFDDLLNRYLGQICGYGYGNMAWHLQKMFTKEEIIEMLIKKYPNEDMEVIVREVNKQYGIWQ